MHGTRQFRSWKVLHEISGFNMANKFCVSVFYMRDLQSYYAFYPYDSIQTYTTETVCDDDYCYYYYYYCYLLLCFIRLCLLWRLFFLFFSPMDSILFAIYFSFQFVRQAWNTHIKKSWATFLCVSCCSKCRIKSNVTFNFFQAKPTVICGIIHMRRKPRPTCCIVAWYTLTM